MLKRTVNIFSNIKDSVANSTTTLEEFLLGVKNGKWQSEIETLRTEYATNGKSDRYTLLKNKLQNISISGTFEGKRANANAVDHTGVIQVDIDGVDDVQGAFKKLCSSPYIAFAFISPSGAGVKAGLRIEQDFSIHKDVHKQAKEFFSIKGWDDSVKDPARVCYVSYDENVYINNSAELFKCMPKKKLPKKNIAKLTYYNDSVTEKWANQLFDSAYKIITEASEGELHSSRLKAGQLLGGGVAHGLFSADDIMYKMESIVEQNTRLNIATAMKDIRDAANNGFKNPLDPPDYVKRSREKKQKQRDLVVSAVGVDKAPEELTKTETVALKDCFFKLLGKTDGHIAIFAYHIGQPLLFSDVGKKDLLKIAPLHYWETLYKKSDDGPVLWDEAISDITHDGFVGNYNPDVIRGSGVWIDEERIVVNTGSGILLDGKTIPYKLFKTDYLYIEGKQLNIEMRAPLVASESIKIFRVAKYLPFYNEFDRRLFFGWIASSIICGGLDWRAHLWLTAPAGSGKSYILDNVVKKLLGSMAIYPQGEETTEAGIRQRIKGDAIAVVHDEAEGETESGRRNTQKKLVLARQASSDSESKIMKGTLDGQGSSFSVRGSFLFSSTTSPEMRRADESRTTKIELMKPSSTNEKVRTSEFKKLKLAVYEVLTEEFCAGFRERLISMVGVIRKSVATYTDVLSLYVDGQRSADQLASILGSAYALESDTPVTKSDAELWCKMQNWEDCDQENIPEHEKCLQTILSLIPKSKEFEDTIGELLENPNSNAPKLLRQYGIVSKDNGVWIANNNHNLKQLLHSTPYFDTYKTELMRIDGVLGFKTPIKINGLAQRGFILPSSKIEHTTEIMEF